jgi:hypothetical protein
MALAAKVPVYTTRQVMAEGGITRAEIDSYARDPGPGVGGSGSAGSVPVPAQPAPVQPSPAPAAPAKSPAKKPVQI